VQHPSISESSEFNSEATETMDGKGFDFENININKSNHTKIIFKTEEPL
jgi:hypothetical protein